MKRFTLLSLIFISPLAFAGKDLDTQAYQISAFNSVTIAEQVAVAKQKITQIEYVELDDASRTKLLAELDVLKGSGLSENDRTESQKRANTLLSKAFADSKLVCTFEKPLGSNMKKRTCMTAGAKKRSFDATQRTIQGQKSNSVHVPQG